MPEVDEPILRVQQDTGCAVGGPSCLSSTFSDDMCVWDLPEREIRKALGAVRKVTPTKDAAMALIQQGMSSAQVADAVGVGVRHVQYLRKKAGLTMPSGRPPADTAQVLPLFMAGVPATVAARQLGKPARTVSGWYQKLRQGVKQ